ncbi:MAG: hypothetical protein OFPI_09640 [Osedax symbiont Rs2]|nr:MAG: hypothetical protein OFPI_09640 [Osedax symbiont Rs2]
MTSLRWRCIAKFVNFRDFELACNEFRGRLISKEHTVVMVCVTALLLLVPLSLSQINAKYSAVC